MARAKGWMFTVNNPGEDDRPYMTEEIEYCVYQLERGAEQTEHYQGYILFKDRKRMSQVKAVPFLRRAHLEVRRGTNEQAIAYCTKVQTAVGPVVELGAKPTTGQGKSKKLAEACRQIRSGTAIRKLDAEFDIARVMQVRGLKELQADVRREQVCAYREVKVVVLWGPTGLGKTRYAYEMFGYENVFKLSQPAQGSNVWFDGYDAQRCLLIDDFEGWIPYRYLLNLLDVYPMELAVKGSFVPALYSDVVITSNVHPIDWYSSFSEFGAIPAPLQRRIFEIREVKEDLFPKVPVPACSPMCAQDPDPLPPTLSAGMTESLEDVEVDVALIRKRARTEL